MQKGANRNKTELNKAKLSKPKTKQNEIKTKQKTKLKQN